MKRYNLNNILDILIEAAYLAIIFLVPVYFPFFFKSNNVFELSKIVLFKILILLLFLLTVVKAVIFNKFYWHFFVSKYFIAPFLFLLAAFLSTIFSINPFMSYYGLYDRQDGLESLIYYIIFFILIFLNIRDADSKKIYNKIKMIVWAAVLSSLIVSIYGLAQIAGFDFLNWNESPFILGRAMSTLGQPNYLASYLLLVIPLNLYLFIQSKKFLVKFFVFLIFLFQLLCLIFTYSRAGWLGFLAGVFITTAVYFLVIGINKEKFKASFRKYQILFFVFLALILFLAGALFLTNKNFFIERVKSSFNLKSGSSAARMEFWRASIDAAKKRPLLGYGPETQGEVLVKYYKKDWAVFGRVNDYPNRAHNLFLDTLLAFGVLGLFFYLVLLYLFFKLTISNIKNSRDYSSLSLVLLMSISGYLVSLFFGFTVAVTNIYFWLIFSLVVLINHHSREKPENFNQKEGGENYESRRPFKKLISLILVIIAGLSIFYQINKEFRRIIADYYFRELKQAYTNKEYYKSIELYTYIKNEKVYDYFYDYYFAVLFSDLLNESNVLVYRKTGGDILLNILNKISGENYSDLFLKAKIHTALANEKNQGLFVLAEENFKGLVNLSPEMPQSYREMAVMYFKQSDYGKAIDSYNKALLFLPDLNSPYINNQHKFFIKFEKYLIYKGLGDVFFKENQYNEAEKYYRLAYDNNMPDISLFKKIADTHYLRGDLDTAIWYNKRGYMLNPNDYVWPFAIAFLYKEKGDKALSMEYAQAALKVLPSNQNIENFINELNYGK